MFLFVIQRKRICLLHLFSVFLWLETSRSQRWTWSSRSQYSAPGAQSPGEPGGENTCRRTCLAPGAPSWPSSRRICTSVAEEASYPSSDEQIKGITFHCCRRKEMEKIKGKQIKGWSKGAILLIWRLHSGRSGTVKKLYIMWFMCQKSSSCTF